LTGDFGMAYLRSVCSDYRYSANRESPFGTAWA